MPDALSSVMTALFSPCPLSSLRSHTFDKSCGVFLPLPMTPGLVRDVVGKSLYSISVIRGRDLVTNVFKQRVVVLKKEISIRTDVHTSRPSW